MLSKMTPWEDLSQRYIKEIKNAQNLFQRAKHLKSRIPATDAPETVKALNALTPAMENLDRTRKRLEAGEFRIAVVGLEKAGKSTFVNAWLGHDLLPSDTSRCTFTTTQIFSVISEKDQVLKVFPKSIEAFRQYEVELEEVAQKEGDVARRAKEDLKTIQEHRSSLEAVIVEGEKHIPFSQISDIQAQLVKYVASPEIAHAVKEVCLYTNRLANADGIVFYDVPGLNSGLGKHIEESKEMLKDCDAIICIQRSKTPSLEASEQQLIEFAKNGDKQVSLAEKLFVFLGQIDIEGSKESLHENVEKAYKEWQARANLPRNHLYQGTAAGHLMMINEASPKLIKQVGSIQKMRSSLESFSDHAQNATQEDLIHLCGIAPLKNRINQYLQEERGNVLSARCDETIRNVRSVASKLFEEIRKKYPDDPELAEKKAEEDRRQKLNAWWRDRWEKTNHIAHECFHKLVSDSISLNTLKKQYETEVSRILKALASRSVQKRDLLFGANAEADATYLNNKWRERLRTETQKAISELASCLTLDFQMELNVLMNTFKEQVWGRQTIEDELIGNNDVFKERITHGLETLFLRFSLPLIDIFLQYPVGTENRMKLIKISGIDMEIIDEYYDGEDQVMKNIRDLAKYGYALISNSLLRQAILKIPVDKLPVGYESFKKEDYPKIARTREEVIVEVEGDLTLLESYLVDSVFSASGLTGYFKQELARLRDKFTSPRLEDVARAIMDSMYHERDPLLMNELPVELRTKSSNIDIVNALKDLKDHLSKI